MHEIHLKFHKQECMSGMDFTVLRHSRLQRNSLRAGVSTGFQGPLIYVPHPLSTPKATKITLTCYFKATKTPSPIQSLELKTTR
jgi:hypothetical protein